ncbi:MAG TPA: Gfo/Idh/MocA family oxidoreductase [Vicinamibacterales bacterium]|nr:Gfo/Idh/MocA family oxidoreductase [Vicinamibacterales bacterium]
MKIHSKPTTRREFLAATGAAAAAFTIVPRHVLGGRRFVAPSDKVNVAIVGAGGQGRTNARALFEEPDCQIIALADPALEWDLSGWYFGGKSGRGPVKSEIEKRYSATTPNYKCATYEDFRVMLEKEKAIDAVLIATPDHLHAYAAIPAMRAGKHVYCEKPLTHNIREARLVARVAKETGVATQMGNQGRSGEGHRQTVEWLKDGAIGTVREVHAWSGNPQPLNAKPPARGPSVKPRTFNWDLWLGTRAERAYSGTYTPFVWRWWWDFGNGTMPDMSPHHFDPAFNALGLDTPATIEARTSQFDEERSVGSHLVTYQFAANATRGPVTVYWYDNGLRPPTPLGLDPDDPLQRLGEGENGLMVVGDKGILTCAGWSGMPRLLPMQLHRDYKRPAKTIPRVAGHHADWLQACKGGTPACSNFDYGARLTEFVLLGALALRAGNKVLKWDAEAMRVTNLPDAQRWIEGTYRKGWELPA